VELDVLEVVRLTVRSIGRWCDSLGTWLKKVVLG